MTLIDVGLTENYKNALTDKTVIYGICQHEGFLGINDVHLLWSLDFIHTLVSNKCTFVIQFKIFLCLF